MVKRVNGLFIILLCFLMIGFLGIVSADPVDVPEVKVEEEVVTEKEVVAEDSGPSFKENIWLFMNSSVGVSVVAFILTFVLGKVFTAKPKWKALVLKYGPQLMQAVKTAEKKIPDGDSRLDGALKYIIELQPKLSKVADADLKQALTAVHASAEKNGNLK